MSFLDVSTLFLIKFRTFSTINFWNMFYVLLSSFLLDSYSKPVCISDDVPHVSNAVFIFLLCSLNWIISIESTFKFVKSFFCLLKFALNPLYLLFYFILFFNSRVSILFRCIVCILLLIFSNWKGDILILYFFGQDCLLSLQYIFKSEFKVFSKSNRRASSRIIFII